MVIFNFTTGMNIVECLVQAPEPHLSPWFKISGYPRYFVLKKKYLFM